MLGRRAWNSDTDRCRRAASAHAKGGSLGDSSAHGPARGVGRRLPPKHRAFNDKEPTSTLHIMGGMNEVAYRYYLSGRVSRIF